FFESLERFLLNIPFFKQVYPALKEISFFIFKRDKVNFKQVVLVEYPRKGLYSVGFITNETSKRISAAVDKELKNVFIPHSPSPLSGFIVLVPKEDIIFVNLSVEEAFKFVISGGVV